VQNHCHADDEQWDLKQRSRVPRSEQFTDQWNPQQIERPRTFVIKLEHGGGLRLANSLDVELVIRLATVG